VGNIFFILRSLDIRAKFETRKKHSVAKEGKVINIESRDAIRVIKMDNAGENKFTQQFIDALNQALDRVEADASAKAAVLTGGAEKYFSTGMDLNWVMTLSKEAWIPFFLEMDKLLLRVFVFGKPLVAAVNGHAFAGGLFLALCTDYRVMREDRGYMCMPEIDLGIHLPPGTVELIAHVMGARNSEFMALSGKRLTAKEACELGAVDELAKAELVLPRSIEIARLLAAKNPKTFAQHKRQLRKNAARVMEIDDPAFIKEFMGKRPGE
jgi:enoyl-CoA hydratase/carnithine racemase